MILARGVSRRVAGGTVRRFTRLTEAIGKKIENHMAAVALGYFAYNFIKIHHTLRVAPATAAGVASKLWEVSGLVAAWEAEERRGESGADVQSGKRAV